MMVIPVAWMFASCVIYALMQTKNIKVHKGRSGANGRRVDGIIALINALGGSGMSTPEETNESYYNALMPSLLVNQ
jgi:phage terminase large subunit-like protein